MGKHRASSVGRRTGGRRGQYCDGEAIRLRTKSCSGRNRSEPELALGEREMQGGEGRGELRKLASSDCSGGGFWRAVVRAQSELATRLRLSAYTVNAGGASGATFRDGTEQV